jgi:hypothetical protein
MLNIGLLRLKCIQSTLIRMDYVILKSFSGTGKQTSGRNLLTPNRKVQPDLLVGCQHTVKLGSGRRLPAHDETGSREEGWRCRHATFRSVGRLPLLQNGRHGGVSFVDGETEQHGMERIGDVIYFWGHGWTLGWVQPWSGQKINKKIFN